MSGGKIITPKDRTFERTQGCWNCSNARSANEFWTDRRKGEVAKLKMMMETMPTADETDAQARKIDTIDHSVAARALVHCKVGRTAKGDPVGDMVAHNYLCEKWSAAEGASLARAGQKADDLPEELADKLDGTPSNDLMRLVNKKLIDN